MGGVKVPFLLVVLLWHGFDYGEAETCEESKTAYAASGFPVEDVPEAPVQGRVRVSRRQGGSARVLYSDVAFHYT